MKRISVFLITIALIAGMVGCGGNGSDPYADYIKIYNWTDLDNIRNNMEAKYVLMNDLDSTTSGYTELASPTANSGKGWQPIGTMNATFTGTFDGHLYMIKDLFIDRPAESFVGLFGRVVEGGVIKNIKVVNTRVTGYYNVGGLVGENYGSVDNSYSTGNVSGDWNVGGLVGENLEGSTVSNSHSGSVVNGNSRVGGLAGCIHESNVSNSYSSGSINGDGLVGGLVGWNHKGTVSNSYSTDSVTGSIYVGGLVGENREGTVSNSFSTGNVSGDWNVGGLMGANNGTVTNSFWDTETSGQSTSAGGTGLNTTQMQDIDTFSGATWNIIEVANPCIHNLAYIWNIVDDETYPFLSWLP